MSGVKHKQGRPKGSKSSFYRDHLMAEPENWQAWQNLYAGNVACQGNHQTTIRWQCIGCGKPIEFDTDNDVKFENILCKDCVRDRVVPDKSKAKLLHILSQTLLRNRLTDIEKLLKI